MTLSDQKRLEAQETVISLKNLSKIYKLYDKHIDRLKESLNPFGVQYHRKFSALNKLDLDVRKGEVLGIIGRNGAGKSTLLNIIAGVTTPSTGEVFTRGKVTAMLGLGTGFNPELTGIENVFINGILQGYSKEQINAKLDDILAFADIGSFVYQPIKIYSSGMQARLGFAIAINVDPDILIIDEVLAVGDELFRRKCYAKINSFVEEGKTILLVFHGMAIVNELCTRAIFLDRGELILEGQPILVTRFYNKLLYANPGESERTREEIVLLNSDIDRKNKFERKLAISNGKTKTEDKIVRKIFKEDQELDSKSYFIPNFIPKSTMKYKYFDVDIYDPQIQTKSGRKVNALVMNDTYLFSFKAKFNLDVENVRYAMAIQNEKGLCTSGITIPDNKKDGSKTLKIKKGDTNLIKIYFRCTLLPGVYYVCVSVIYFDEDMEKVVLTRADDISAFKVQQQVDLNIWGTVFLDQAFEISAVTLQFDSQ